MREYKDLLPSYLDGENINKHAKIIQEQDQQIYEKIRILQGWNNLNRPILIERVQTEPGVADCYIHINTPSPIRKITTSGLVNNITREYTEEELITNTTLKTTVNNEIPPVMPRFKVTVETYDNITYTKGYYENDTPMGNEYDHDEFIDIIGNLLGIPRRIYKEQDYGQYINNYKYVYPPFFTKTMWKSDGYLTEDDYYYVQRLKKFLNEYPKKPLPVLMAEILYEWKSTTYSNMKTRNSSLTPELKEHAGEPILCITNDNPNYVNIDYTGITEKINQYSQITRPLILTQPLLVEAVINNSSYTKGVLRLEGGVWAGTQDYEEEYELYHAPLRVTITDTDTNETIEHTIYSNDDDTNFSAEITGLTSENIKVTLEYQEEYGNKNIYTGNLVMHMTKDTPYLRNYENNILEGEAEIIVKLARSSTAQNSPLTNQTINILENNNIIATGTTDTNGNATIPLNTLPCGTHKLQIQYPGTIEYKSLTINMELQIQARLGKNAPHPWTKSMWNKILITDETARAYFTHRDCKLTKLPLTGDFKIEFDISTTSNNRYAFGLTTDNETVVLELYKDIGNCELRGDDTEVIPPIFPSLNSLVHVSIERMGTDYEVILNNESYYVTTTDESTVYIRMDKWGSGYLVLDNLTSTIPYPHD